MEVKYKVLILSAVVSMAITGCGGSGGGSSAAPEAATGGVNTAVEGVVADGYLYGATVCLDLNDNKRCDDNEPTATTGNGGKYTLSNVNSVDAKSHGIVVEVSADTIDEDTNKTVGKSYVLTSPPGKPAFVSPLSTLVHSAMGTLKTTLEDAENIVKQNIAYGDDDISLFKDYVEAANNDERYKELHKIAQISARIMGDNHGAINAAAHKLESITGQALSSDIQNLIVQHVFAQLSHIKAVALAKTDDSEFTLEDLKGLALQIDTENLAAILEKESAKRLASNEFDLKALLTTTGIHSIEKDGCDDAEASCNYDYYQDVLTAKKVDAGYALENDFRVWNGTDWSDNNENSYWDRSSMLVEGKWVFNNAKNVRFTQNNSNELINSPGAVGSFVEINVEGQKVVDYLKAETNWSSSESINAELTDVNARFSPGAKAYLTFNRFLSDEYVISLDSDDDKCLESLNIGWVDEKTNCNAVVNEGTSDKLTSIDELYSSDAAPEVFYADGLHVKINRMNTTDTQGIAEIRLASSDTFIPIKWRLEEPVAGIELLVVEVPAEMKMENGYRLGRTSVFFVVIDGLLRSGSFTPKGTITEWSSYEFNSVAMEDILDQFTPLK